MASKQKTSSGSNRGSSAASARKKSSAGKKSSASSGKSSQKRSGASGQKQQTSSASSRQIRQSAAGSAKQTSSADAQTKPAVRSARAQRAYLRQLRIEQKAQQEQEENLRRRSVPMWGKTLIAVAVVLILMLVFFRVSSFEVTGNVHYTADEIAEASGITEGDVLMGVNKTEAASRILVKLPYITQVVVSKSLPGQVQFDVVECEAAAAAVSEFGTVWLMNSDGKLLEKLESGTDSGYPVINGPVLNLPVAGDPADFDNDEAGALGLSVAIALNDTGLADVVESIDISDTGEITLDYGGRIEVWLGDGSNLAYKLACLTAAAAELGDNARGALDLQFTSGTSAVYHPLA